MRQTIWALGLVFFVANIAPAAELTYKDALLAELAKEVPSILKTYDSRTGRFGTGVWTCQDQHPMYPLAVAYATPGKGNRYHKDPELLKVIAKSADPLIENMDAQGRWVFQKKDGSTWGMTFMPWTYSRWIRTYALVCEDLPAEAREAWTKALTLGYTGINKTCLGGVHNIATHHAMGLFAAGKALDRPEWRRQAADFMRRVIAAQAEGGYWAEGGGPVVNYDFVYVDAMGTYYAMSRDERVLPALEKSASFHRHFTYPGGESVETIDQRNPFHHGIEPGNVGFTFTAVGRAFLQNQWTRLGLGRLDKDLIASLLLYGDEGPVEPLRNGADNVFVLTEGGIDRAATIRRGPWFVCLSAYTTPIAESRWHQDRQSFVSVYHEKTGLILGGGNTKLQPAWSNFTVGDTALLSHKPGDRNPRFRPRGELYHVPLAAKLLLKPEAGLDLTYGAETCSVRVRPKDERTLECLIETDAESALPVAAHLTLLPSFGEPLQTAAGTRIRLGEDSLSWSPDQIGAWIAHAGCRLYLPASASLHWPALPHNPYRIDGRADVSEGRIEIRIPFDREHRQYLVKLEIIK